MNSSLHTATGRQWDPVRAAGDMHGNRLVGPTRHMVASRLLDLMYRAVSSRPDDLSEPFQQVFQFRRVHGFDEMQVNTCLVGPKTGGFVTVPANRDNQRSSHPVPMLANLLRH